MKSVISRCAYSAKENVCPPTEAQARWLDDARALLELADQLARDGRRLRHARHEAPEVEVLSWLVLALQRGPELAARARAEGRALAWVLPPLHEGLDTIPALRLAPAGAKVIELSEHRKRRA